MASGKERDVKGKKKVWRRRRRTEEESACLMKMEEHELTHTFRKRNEN